MNFGHKIVQLQLRVRPTVLNNPRHPKHETIPASVFMPGKPEKMATLRQQEQKPFRVSSACCTVLVFNALHTSLPLDTEAHYQFSAGAEGPMWNGGEALSSLSRVSKYDLVFQRHLDGWRGECLESAEGGRHVSGIVNSHMSISACFWAWWKTQPNPRQNETVAPAYLAHKYL